MIRGASKPQRFAALLTCVALLACGETRKVQRQGPVEAEASRVDVFLRAQSRGETRVVMFLGGVRLRDAAGAEHEVLLSRSRIDPLDAAHRIAVAGSVVPPGNYEALILTVREAEDDQGRPLRLAPGDGDGPLPAPEVGAPDDEPPTAMEYEHPLRLVVGRHEAASIFLDWNVEGSLVDGAFRPAFGLTLETPQVRLGLLYVADAASGSIVAVDRASGEIVATGKVGAGPRALALSRDRSRLYVANGGDGSVSIVDTRRNFAESTIPIRMTAEVSDIAVAFDERFVVTANSALDTVSFIEVLGTARVDDVRVGRAPRRLATSDRLRRLYVVNRRSDDMTVIDLNTRNAIATVPVESAPVDVVTDRRGTEIFVGHESSQNLLVLDAESLAVVDTVFVGGNVSALAADRRRDRIYVARAHPFEISVVDRRLSAVVRRITISGRVEALAQPPEGSLIYGAAPDLGGLVVVDLTAGREVALLPCRTTPIDVVAVE